MTVENLVTRTLNCHTDFDGFHDGSWRFIDFWRPSKKPSYVIWRFFWDNIKDWRIFEPSRFWVYGYHPEYVRAPRSRTLFCIIIERKMIINTKTGKIYIFLSPQLRSITNRMKREEEERVYKNDWKFAAMVVDRICMIFFTLFTIVATIIVLGRAPHWSLWSGWSSRTSLLGLRWNPVLSKLPDSTIKKAKNMIPIPICSRVFANEPKGLLFRRAVSSVKLTLRAKFS